MVTAAQIDRLGKRIDQLSAVIDPAQEAVKVVVFAGESPEFALARHRELRPEHAGRLVKLEYRNEDRDHVRELAAVFIGATPQDMAEFRKWMHAPKPEPRHFVADRS